MRANTPYRAGLCIALIAMLFRAFLPSGWMPAPTAHAGDDPWISFVICTSEGLVQLDDASASFYQDQEKPSDNNGAAHSYSACPYATTTPLATPVTAVIVAQYPIDFIAAKFHAADPTLVHKDLFQRKRSRAPPVLAS